MALTLARELTSLQFQINQMGQDLNLQLTVVTPTSSLAFISPVLGANSPSCGGGPLGSGMETPLSSWERHLAALDV